MNTLSTDELYHGLVDYLAESLDWSPDKFRLQGSLEQSNLEVTVPDPNVVSRVERYLADTLGIPVDHFEVVSDPDWFPAENQPATSEPQLPGSQNNGSL